MAKAQAISGGRGRVIKRKSGKQARKLKSGLLDVSIPQNATHLAEITQRNSTQSLLLRLPPEIRNKIWKYAVGGLEIHIKEIGTYCPPWLSYGTRPIGAKESIFKCPRFTFHLHQVSRQAYFEVSPFIYTLNTFSFDGVMIMDRWIKIRALGQMQLVTSINIPFGYFSLYIQGFRRIFRKKFPNIKRIGIYEHSNPRLGETKEETKEYIVKQVHLREGDGVMVEWR
ncbi:hypothetical protein P171DRAFT_65653 [Karstenula rhodostoma CBS 690.94]|uniref:Uncharacterized protein n=1 Tax=Karstenula rhodostoma CBS 690.94 TaxID=1392251 RepID=A0A9P4PE88_9PLEO|nr:hypothetical protein P171DRAFT_65653 [Karstenula rhodostoma CBS 690.94]